MKKNHFPTKRKAGTARNSSFSRANTQSIPQTPPKKAEEKVKKEADMHIIRAEKEDSTLRAIRILKKGKKFLIEHEGKGKEKVGGPSSRD